eukprot:TRINITY_DN9808_c0_g1_i3.p1 TRINITY_DN9808_c0_g1~~TRINITY_DN9808_c0_g1_i3.p1  ORF type:complete len:356 (-),score=46.42 TRINITY_DN9808_c0_g1_i3:251-1318(-)
MKCGITKSVKHYYSNIKNPDGINDLCRKCQRCSTKPAQYGIPLLKSEGTPKSKERREQKYDMDRIIQCATCGVSKPLKKFYKRIISEESDEAVYNCRSCTKIDAKRRRIEHEPESIQPKTPPSSLPTKFCERCENEKSTNQFYSCKNNMDGLGTFCRKCTKEIKRGRDQWLSSSPALQEEDVFLLPIAHEDNNVDENVYEVDGSQVRMDWVQELVDNYAVNTQEVDNVDWSMLHLQGCSSAITASTSQFEANEIGQMQNVQVTSVGLSNVNNNDNNGKMVLSHTSNSNNNSNQDFNRNESSNSTEFRRLNRGVSIQLSAEIGGIVAADPVKQVQVEALGGQPKFQRQNSAVQMIN